LAIDALQGSLAGSGCEQ